MVSIVTFRDYGRFFQANHWMKWAVHTHAVQTAAPENIVESVPGSDLLPVQTKGKHPLHLIKPAMLEKAATVDAECRCGCSAGKHPVNLLQIILQDPAMKLMVHKSSSCRRHPAPVIVQVVMNGPGPVRRRWTKLAQPPISPRMISLQKLLRLKGNPAEIPVKLHLCMGIPIFVQLYDRKLLIKPGVPFAAG